MNTEELTMYVYSTRSQGCTTDIVVNWALLHPRFLSITAVKTKIYCFFTSYCYELFFFSLEGIILILNLSSPS